MKHPFRRTWIACLAIAIAGAGALSTPALAQETYYKEVVVEGRIYVFSSEAAQKAWEASKEMPVGAITRPGYAPGGETVFFDSPKAVELFNQKHGTTDAPPKETKSEDVKLPFNVQYRMPGLRLTFPKAEINLSNRLQVRFTQQDMDTNALQSDKGTFQIRRMRVKFDGWIYSKDLTYELQWDLATIDGNQLQDANLDYDFTGGKKFVRLKAGQFKAPFSQQQLTSSGNQQFVDRAITDAFFVPGRQLGVQLWGQLGPPEVADMIDWRFGVFNGNGRTTVANDNDKFEYVARLMVSPFGSPGYSESNLEGYDFRLGIAAEYNDNDRIVRPATGDPTGTNIEYEYGGSLVIKAAKIVFLYGEYYQQDVKNPAGARTKSNGFVAQAGVLVLPRLEIAGRYAQIDPNRNVDDNLMKEYRGAISYYINRHNWKIQADYGELRNQASSGADGLRPRKDKEFRLQAQLIF